MNKPLPFPQQLKHQRKLKGWSQADLAEKVDSDPQTVRRWENGKTLPRPYHQQKLFEVFGMDAEAFGLIDGHHGHENEHEVTPSSPQEDQEEHETLDPVQSKGSEETKDGDSTGGNGETPQRTADRRLKMRLPIIALVVTALLATLLVPSSTFLLSQIHKAPSISLQSAHLSGWLFMQSKTPGGVELLKTLSLQTGQTRPLVASNQVLQNSTTVPYLTNYAAPYYSSATHQLVFTATNGNGRRDVWIATVIFGKDGWPTLSTSPTSLMPCDASCGNILTWSPSGEWLIFKGKDGLYAINISTHHQQRITSSPRDKWPACSPDGTWLAYQGVYNTVEAVPSKDCLPTPDAAIPKRFVNNINYSWKPGWSADGKKVTFLSNIAGENEVFYEIAFRDMSPYNPDSPILYSRAGPPSCTSITWMHRQSSQQEIAIFACKDSKQENKTFGSYLLIEPDVLQPDWKLILNAGNDVWDWLDWVPPAASS